MPKPLLPLLNAAPAATRPFDDKARAQMAEWVDNWKRVGPILEAERVAGLRALSETESARIAVELLWPMAPIGGGDAGEGLVRIQAALRRLAEAPVAHHPLARA